MTRLIDAIPFLKGAVQLELSDGYVKMARKNPAQDTELIGLTDVSVEGV
jgi:hypothetical protein